MTTQAVPRPAPSSFALGPDGQIWLADGTCAEPGTFGRVMVSSDHGDRWRPIAVKTLSAQPVRQVILDRSHAGTALIFTASCGSAAHTEPGWIYLTDNGGKTFRAVAVPPGIPDENGPPLRRAGSDPGDCRARRHAQSPGVVRPEHADPTQPDRALGVARRWSHLATAGAGGGSAEADGSDGGDRRHGAGHPQGRSLPNQARRGSGSHLSLNERRRRTPVRRRPMTFPQFLVIVIVAFALLLNVVELKVASMSTPPTLIVPRRVGRAAGAGRAGDGDGHRALGLGRGRGLRGG